MLIKQTSLNMSRKKCRINELLSMCNVALGLAGISVLLLYDLASLRLFPNRVFLAALGYGLHGFAILAAAAAEEQLQLPVEAKFLAGPPVSGSWLALLLFVFLQTPGQYIPRKTSSHRTRPLCLDAAPGFSRSCNAAGGFVFRDRIRLPSARRFFLDPGESRLYIHPRPLAFPAHF